MYSKKYINYREKIKEILILINNFINLITNYRNNLKEERNNLKEERNNLKEERNNLKEERNNLKEEINNMKEERNNLKEEINNMKEKINNMKEKINNLKQENEDMKNIKKYILLLELEINKISEEKYIKKREFIKKYKIEEGNINMKNISDIKKKLIELDNKNNFDIIFTHNECGEYGNLQHKFVNFVIKKLKEDEWKHKDIYTSSNIISNIYIKINNNNKQELLKTYDFKDSIEIKNRWFQNCIKNYSFWSDNEYEYYKEIII